ncbi:MAG TPA: hypothetical protein VEJ40_02285 [Pseudolabrys sp.]|nr:hypothetical protein [Pseudolabrys sp.]
MNTGDLPRVPITKRLTDELVEFVVIAAYLWICFTAILYLKSSILKAEGIAFAPFGFAVVKALICAKFASLGRIFHVGERFQNLPLIWPTLYRSFAFLVLLFVLNALEEVVTGLMHGRTSFESLAAMGGGSLDQLIATSIVGLLILIPFFGFRVLGEVVGERNLVRVFFRPRAKIDK